MDWLEDRLGWAVEASINEMEVRQLRSSLRRYRDVYQAEDSTEREKQAARYYINKIKRILQKKARY